MNITELNSGIDKIIEEANDLIKIPAQEIAKLLVHFCQENDIEPNSPEFDTVMNHGGWALNHWMSFYFAMEKLKATTTKPTGDKLNEN